jgi:hypothetical protein
VGSTEKGRKEIGGKHPRTTLSMKEKREGETRGHKWEKNGKRSGQFYRRCI